MSTLFNMEERDESFVVALTKPKGLIFPAFSLFVRYAESFYQTMKRYKKSGEWSWKLQQYSHVLVLWKNNKHDRVMAYEASGNQVKMLGFNALKTRVNIVRAWRLPDLPDDEDREEAIKWCIDHAGDPYPKNQIVGTVFVKVAELFDGKIRKNPWANGDYMQYCIELVARFLSRHYEAKIRVDFENALTSDTPEIMNGVEGAVELDLSLIDI